MTTPVSLASAQATIKIGGLSGLKTEEIVSDIMSVERRPLTRLDEEEAVRKDEEAALHGVLSSVEALSQSTAELGSPTIYAQTQSVSSSESNRVIATSTGTAPVGAHEVEVFALASAAQRSFSYAPPEAAQTVTIDGHEVKLGAHEGILEVASAINANPELTVYASVVGEQTLVLSERATGRREGSYINVVDAGEALHEIGGSARAGTDAEYEIDDIAGTSASNTLAQAIPGITLDLLALTSTGPVTVDVSPPSTNTETLANAVKAFVSQYNSTLAKLQSEVSTQPASELQGEAESGSGTLFSDGELQGLLGSMRQSVYGTVAGLPGSMSSLEDIGIDSGSPSATPSQSEIEGKLTINEAKLEEALHADPEGVRKLLEGWSSGFQETVEAYSGTEGVLSARIENVQSQVTHIDEQVSALDEVLAVRQHSLEREYQQLEVVIRDAHAQSSWLSSQLASLSNASSSSSTTESSGL